MRPQNWDDLRLALKLTHIFWGGKFNPIIPVGSPSTKELIERFRVDALFPVNESSEAIEFTKGFHALEWPLFDRELVNKLGNGTPNFLDVSHPLTAIAKRLRDYERKVENDTPAPVGFGSSQYVIVRWSEDDPLKDVLLATFGAYPAGKEAGRDYEGFLVENIMPFAYNARPEECLPFELIDRLSISDISSVGLIWDRIPSNATIGFYVGSANDFDDIVNYWNLRASDLQVLFLDPSHAERMKQLRRAHSDEVIQRHLRDRQSLYVHTNASWDQERIPVWSRSQEAVAKLEFPKEDVPTYRRIEGTAAIGPDIKPPLHYFSRRTVLASIADRHGKPTLSFQFPDKPFAPYDLSEEHFIVSITAPSEDPDEWNTFWTPYVPDLNQWYGQQLILSGRSARVEVDGIGVVIGITDENLTLRPIKKTELAAKLFELAGIHASPSHPGRIAGRLITQLGGFLGCRVLKIAGVRKLIREYSPLQEFDRTEAIRIIGNRHPETGVPRFADYEKLFIEERDFSTKLKPEDVFAYLLERGVFRAGITLTCTICELPFWISIDDASTETTCEVCGGKFNVLRQLRTRDWKYRRSGIFGIDNHQEGSIPVALTLQQLNAHFDSLFGSSLFLPNMKLEPAGANIEACETDIFVAIREGSETLMAVGECKDAGGCISKEDARKMAGVADALSDYGLHCYIVFSKTAPFTGEEVENCRLANESGSNRVIMLSDRELEPYHVYEKSSKEFELRRQGRSLRDMALATHDIFFAPRPKQSTGQRLS
ncbi:MAG: hypothetical protein WBV69_15995 [Candidatus Sulfotelmatobacter sp.]